MIIIKGKQFSLPTLCILFNDDHKIVYAVASGRRESENGHPCECEYELDK